MDTTLVSALARHYRDRPDAVFAWFLREDAETVVTFRDLARGAAGMAQRYRDAGLGPDDTVAIILDHRPDLLFAFAGALLHGAKPAFMPFPSSRQDPVHYWSSHREVFARNGTRVVVTYAELAPVAQECLGAEIAVLVIEEMAGAREPEFTEPGADEVAFLQHTSGTTGLKKGVMLSHRAVLAQVASYAAALPLRPDAVFASWLPLYHDMGLIACFITPLVLGLPVAMISPFEWVYRPRLFLEAVARYRATHAWLPNFSYLHMVAAVDGEPQDLSSLEALINCSEPCKPAAFERFLARFGSWGLRPQALRTCYAMAETVFAATQSGPGPVATHRGLLSVGRPIAGVEVKLVDGEIAVRAPFLFAGYHRQATDTLRDGWYHTGDLGFWHDGELYVSGRLKDILIVNGRNYYAHDIEFVASEQAGVKGGRVVAVGVYDEALGSEDVVVIAETAADASELPALKKRVRAAIADALDLLVREVYLVAPGWIVKTTSGKISRDQNRTKYQSERGAGHG